MMTRPSALLLGRLAGLLLVGSGLVTGIFVFLPTPDVLDRRGVLVVSAIAIGLGVFARFAPWDSWPRQRTLWLLPPAFGLIAAGNYYGMNEPWTFGLYFIVGFAWLGIGHRRWLSLWFAPLAAVAYVTPILLRPDADPRGATSALITIPISVLVAEMLAWNSAREARSAERAEALARAATALGAHLSEDDVLQTLADETRRALEADHATLYRVDPSTMRLGAVYVSGIEEPFLEQVRAFVGRDLADIAVFGDLAGGSGPVVLDDAAASDRVPREIFDMLRVRSALAIPISADDELIGVLACAESARSRHYTADDIALAEALASQAGAAMRNALLYRKAFDAARTDPLTGLGNRRAFQDRLSEEVERALRYGRPLSLVLIDTDDFKRVNDTWGHQTGDVTLTQVAVLLDRTGRQEDIAFRIGGDEFAVILPETTPDGASTLAERIRRTIQRSHLGTGSPRTLTVSVGASSLPTHASTVDELFSRADTALYEVKRAGGDAVSIPPAVHRTGPAVLFGVDLRQVIEGRRVFPLYQPIVDLRTGETFGYEGVSRLDPALGNTPTTTLFRAARTLGLTHGLDRTCRVQVLGGATALPPDAKLFLNVSATVLQLGRFSTSEILKDVDDAGISRDRVVLEVTEGDRSPHSRPLARNLEELRDAGLAVALDDLGSGASDLDILGDLPFDYIKVDMAFVQGAFGEDHRRRLLHGLRLLVAETGARAIAEGVETADDLQLVREIGFGAAQGFVLGEPVELSPKALDRQPRAVP